MRNHDSVNHGVGEYVRDMAHINGVESFWALLKRGYCGTYHKMSPWPLNLYADVFSGQHSARELDTAEQIDRMAARLDGKRLSYADLTEKDEEETGF